MERKSKILWITILILIFSLGYYLRAYIPLHKDLPYSPYEAFVNTPNATEFIQKQGTNPTTQFIGRFLTPVFGNLYLIYIFGAIIIFFLGKEITDKNLGGILAFPLYALSSENLLQYTRTINNSGLCYVFTLAALLFFLKYLKSKENQNIIIFTIFSILALTSYHTGATALIMLIIGLLISLVYSSKLDKKIFLSFISLTIFYVIWIFLFDRTQLPYIAKAFTQTGYLKISIILAIALMIILILSPIKKIKSLQSEYIPLIMLFPAAILIFSKFSFLLNLGVKNYYISTITLNNYIAQALLTHSYIVILLPILFKKKIKENYILLKAWLIGLILISIGLILKSYYSRIFDYSFPLMFLLFGLYWSKKKKFRTIVVTTTIILLTLSQLMIYNDPFSMRRYYNQNEIDSAKNIIALNLNGKIVSDLRTSALFSYLGKDIKFGKSSDKLHDTIFYEYWEILRLTVKANDKKIIVDYIILSESMRNIVYARNFETFPLKDDVFNYYKSNFEEVYNDGLMYVYRIKK